MLNVYWDVFFIKKKVFIFANALVNSIQSHCLQVVISFIKIIINKILKTF